jgi:myosin I
MHHDMSTADAGFRDKCSGQHGGHAHYGSNSRGFFIKHYAGEVQYDMNGFAEKNRDVLVPELVLVMQSSGAKFIQHMFPEEIEVGGQRKAPPTAGSQMVLSCGKLVEALMRCQPHYIRCIKPNDKKAANSFDKARSLHQVKYLGLSENVRVRRAGYAYRATYERFLTRFYLVSPDTFYLQLWTRSAKKGCEAILRSAGIEKSQSQLGNSKIFLKDPETLFLLEERRDQVFAMCAVKIQRAFRVRKQREQSLQLRSRFNDMICGEKERRRASVFRPFDGDYLHHREDSRLLEIMAFVPISETVLFTSGVTRYALTPPDPKAKGDPPPLGERCLFVMTDVFVYLVQSPQNGMRLLLRIPIKAVDKASMSRNADNFVVLHVNAGAKPPLRHVDWKPDQDVKTCRPCGKGFGFFRRRHHCRVTLTLTLSSLSP